MFCRRCGGPQHVCARPGCGHSRFGNHEKDKDGVYCNWRQHGALLACHCTGYLESDAEKECREEAEEEDRWPTEIVALIRNLWQERPHHAELERLTLLGEKLLRERKIVVQSYK